MQHEFLTNRVPEAASYLLAYIAAAEDVLRENKKSVQMRNSTHCLMATTGRRRPKPSTAAPLVASKSKRKGSTRRFEPAVNAVNGCIRK